MKCRTGLRGGRGPIDARNPMAAQQIPSGTKGLRCGPRGNGNRASQWLFGAKSPAKRRHLRRNGPVRVQFLCCKPPDRFRSRGMNPSAPRHVPVLGREAVAMLEPRDGGIYLDATFGAGGYTRAILDVEGTRVIGVDRDRTAIAGGFDLVDRSAGPAAPVGGRVSPLPENLRAGGNDPGPGVRIDAGRASMDA